MSEKKTYSITCPRCRKALDVELFESINVKAEPDLKQQLMMNQINAVKCPDCDLSFRVDKPLLYSDPAQRLLIYWFPHREENFEDGEERFGEWLREMGTIMPDGVRAPDVHLVFTRTELIERIFLKEAGLDERIIEYIKYMIYSKNSGRLDPTTKILLFNAQDSTDLELCFVVQDAGTRQFEAMLKYGRDTYRALAEAFGTEEKSADLLELFPGPYISARALIRKESDLEPPEDVDPGESSKNQG